MALKCLAPRQWVYVAILLCSVACSQQHHKASWVPPGGVVPQSDLPDTASSATSQSPAQQLAELALQEHCARDARRWFGPDDGLDHLITQIHYSATEGGCYAVSVDNSSNSVGDLTVDATVAILWNVNANTLIGQIQLSRSYEGGQTHTAVDECTLDGRKCSARSLQEWYRLALAYLKN